MITIQEQNGLDLPASQLLREFAREYSSRLFKGDLNDLPASFNVAEAFVNYIPKHGLFQLRPETDYSFSMFDFLEYATEADSPSSLRSLNDSMIEGHIYSFSSRDDPSGFVFGSAGEHCYGVTSVSLIRFGSELSVMTQAGRVCDLGDETKKLENRELPTALPHRVHLSMNLEEPFQAIPLYDESPLWKTVALVRLDIETETIDARYVLKDTGPSYDVICDDMSILHDGAIEDAIGDSSEFMSNLIEELRPHQALFEICKSCALLPKYVSERDEDIKVERHATPFLEFRKKIKNRKIVEAIGASPLKTAHRQLFVVSESGKIPPNALDFYPPEFRVETSGYWKKLAVGVKGEDKHGNPIQGRTWVRKTLSWAESSDDRQPLSVRSTVPRSNIGPNSGVLYVMRSAAHADDVFKIGMTRRSATDRSCELNRATGVPDKFLTVQEWSVDDCVETERLVHTALKAYRLNPRREFFRADYSVIHGTIQRVIRDQQLK